MKELSTYLQKAQDGLKEVVFGARNELLQCSGNIAEALKGDKSPVTRLDKEMETRIRNTLAFIDPRVPIVGEEFGGDDSTSTFWLIDPIDGTESFIRGLPFYRNMATLIYDNEPAFAFVYKPAVDELFTATKGLGAFKNGERISIGERKIDRAWLDIAWPVEIPESALLFSAIKPEINNFRMIGDFTAVAEGKVDGSISYKPGGGMWDYAPRSLLFTEAGGKIANIGNDATDVFNFRNYNYVAANPVIFDTLLGIVNKTLSNFDTEDRS